MLKHLIAWSVHNRFLVLLALCTAIAVVPAAAVQRLGNDLLKLRIIERCQPAVGNIASIVCRCRPPGADLCSFRQVSETRQDQLAVILRIRQLAQGL